MLVVLVVPSSTIYKMKKTTHSWAKLRISYLYCVVELATAPVFPSTRTKKYKIENKKSKSKAKLLIE